MTAALHRGHAPALSLVRSVPMHQVWQVSTRARMVTLAFGPLAGLISWLRWADLLGACVVMLLAAPLAAFFAFYPAVTLTDNELIVRNPGGQVRVPLAEIVSVAPGFWGLAITTTRSGPLLALAVAKSTLATRKGRSARADEVAASIMSAVRGRAEAN